MLHEFYRILKPNGFLILSTPNLAAWASRILLLFGKPPLYYDCSLKYTLHRPTYGHMSLYTKDLLKLHLEAVGFRVVNIQGMLTPWYKANKVVELITLFLADRIPSLAPDLLVIAQKPDMRRL
jgi:2-polyprenyl-3-methyl-5-hydroxy-6-metoxy-1,4-benzoquinol methylase